MTDPDKMQAMSEAKGASEQLGSSPIHSEIREPELKIFPVQIKCTRTHPCSSCSAANVRCEFREDDFKRPPVSREYIAALESRVATLEAVIGRLKAGSPEERDEILEGVTLEDQTQPFAPETAADPDANEIALSDAIRKATLHETDEGMPSTHMDFSD